MCVQVCVCVCVCVHMPMYMYYVFRSVGNSYGDVADNSKDLARGVCAPCSCRVVVCHDQ